MNERWGDSWHSSDDAAAYSRRARIPLERGCQRVHPATTFSDSVRLLINKPRKRRLRLLGNQLGGKSISYKMLISEIDVLLQREIGLRERLVLYTQFMCLLMHK